MKSSQFRRLETIVAAGMLAALFATTLIEDPVPGIRNQTKAHIKKSHKEEPKYEPITKADLRPVPSPETYSTNFSTSENPLFRASLKRFLADSNSISAIVDYRERLKQKHRFPSWLPSGFSTNNLKYVQYIPGYAGITSLKVGTENEQIGLNVFPDGSADVRVWKTIYDSNGKIVNSGKAHNSEIKSGSYSPNSLNDAYTGLALELLADTQVDTSRLLPVANTSYHFNIDGSENNTFIANRAFSYSDNNRPFSLPTVVLSFSSPDGNPDNAVITGYLNTDSTRHMQIHRIQGEVILATNFQLNKPILLHRAAENNFFSAVQPD